MKYQTLVNKAIRVLCYILGASTAGCGLVLFGYQVLIYLRSGYWPSYPLLFVFALMPDTIFADWLRNPTSWPGLHKIVYTILEMIPISLALTVVGLVVLWCGLRYGKNGSR